MAESDRAGSESRRGSEATTGSKTVNRRKSRLLSIARQSFVKSGGQRGASVETLRGTHGADFENKAVVTRGGGEGVFCGCFGSSDSDEVLVLIKGPFLFVFKNEKSQSPKYAVTLAHLQASVKEEGHGLSTHGYTTVNLETVLGDVEYTVKFHTDGHLVVATTFANVVTQQAATGEADEVRKRLGHSNISTKRGSVAYAESIALKKVKDQPEKVVSRDEIVEDIMPAVGTVAGGGYMHGPI